jgi:hypothetical protein
MEETKEKERNWKCEQVIGYWGQLTCGNLRARSSDMQLGDIQHVLKIEQYLDLGIL